MNINEQYPDRRGKITASQAFAVQAKGRTNELGKMALTYANELVLARLGIVQDNFTSWQMEIGIEREPDARLIYEKSRNVKVKLPGFVTMPGYDFIGCTPDGVADWVLLEIKCPQPKAHLDYLLNGIPDNYYAQVQFQMMVTGAKCCDFMTFNPEFSDKLKAKVYRIEPDQLYQDNLLQRCIAMNDYVTQILKSL